jgi:hypothetical protein
MNERLRMCSGCQRHVFAREAACPFCGATVPRGEGGPSVGSALVVATAVALGVAAAGCDNKPAQGPINAPTDSSATPTPTPTGSSSAAPNTTAPEPLPRGPQNPAPIYGGPPPP